MPLAQEGLDGTVRDLLFASIGALVVAVFGRFTRLILPKSFRNACPRPSDAEEDCGTGQEPEIVQFLLPSSEDENETDNRK